MNDDRLTEMLAAQVLGWKSAPGRFLQSGRRWTPSWRFQPTRRLADAFRLLEAASPQTFVMSEDDKGVTVRVQIGEATGEAHGRSRAETITVAIARASGIAVDSIE